MNNISIKSKIFNDPVHGFISVPDLFIFQLLEHPYFQRLRRIKQLGLTNLVYPGALHTRFHHTMGAMHLMGEAIKTLRIKNISITSEEEQAAMIAILMHDIGHGPFSHALEYSIVNNIHHEVLSDMVMKKLNREFKGKLDLAIKIFTDKYKKKFLHQLVSSQLDVDRLDYLKRDSFYTGVSEGVISSDRIIKMMNVVNNELVVEHKGIYSVEKFIIARRLMYWQVYLHKAVISAENLLVKILQRAKELAQNKVELFATAAFKQFLYNTYSVKDFEKNEALLESFLSLDDYDIMASVKEWKSHPDKVLSHLCFMLLNRKLYKTEIQNKSFDKSLVEEKKKLAIKKLKLVSEKDAGYFAFTGEVQSDIYRIDKIRINIMYKNGSIADISEASDQLNVDVLNKTVKKYYLSYLK